MTSHRGRAEDITEAYYRGLFGCSGASWSKERRIFGELKNQFDLQIVCRWFKFLST